MTTGEVTDVIDEGVRILKNMDVLYLLDTGTGQALGGTGQVFDWAIAQEVAAKYPVMVAGGLTPDNVTDLINRVHPWGVDVSGGVESGGIKDIEKIKIFIQAVKQADAMFGEGKRR
jgi:phosphoribosylanthranilate isomerase